MIKANGRLEGIDIFTNKTRTSKTGYDDSLFFCSLYGLSSTYDISPPILPIFPLLVQILLSYTLKH